MPTVVCECCCIWQEEYSDSPCDGGGRGREHFALEHGGLALVHHAAVRLAHKPRLRLASICPKQNQKRFSPRCSSKRLRPNPHWTCARKFEHKSSDVACMQCGHPHSHQLVPFALRRVEHPVWMRPEQDSEIFLNSAARSGLSSAEKTIRPNREKCPAYVKGRKLPPDNGSFWFICCCGQKHSYRKKACDHFRFVMISDFGFPKLGEYHWMNKDNIKV